MADVKYFADLNALVPASPTDDAKIMAIQSDPKGSFGYKSTLTNIAAYVGSTSVTGFLKADGTVPLTADWDAGAFKITAETLESDIVTGTAPIIVASTTKVANLNVDQVDGFDMDQDVLIASSPTFVGATLSGLAVAGGIAQTDAAGVLSSSVTLPDGTFATTQGAGDNTTLLATTAFVQTAISAGSGITPQDLTSQLGAGGVTIFTLSTAPVAGNKSQLFYNGQLVPYGTFYTISGTTLTWIGSYSLGSQAAGNTFWIFYDITITPPGTLDQVQIYYAADAGLDSNDGKSIEKPFLTPPAAAAEILLQTPSSINKFELQMIGAMRYTGNLTIPNYTTVTGEGEIIGDVTLGIGSTLYVNVTGKVTKATSGSSFINNSFVNNPADSAIVQSAGDLYVKSDVISNAGTNQCILKTGSGSDTYLDIKKVTSSASADTVSLSAGFSYNNIGLIQKTNATGSAFKCLANHNPNGSISEIIASTSTALDFGGGSNINLRVGNYTGLISDDSTNSIRLKEIAPAAFAAYNLSSTANFVGDGSTVDVILSTEDADVGGNYNTGTGVFTAPLTGLYQFDAIIFCDTLGAANNDGYFKINVTGAAAQDWILYEDNPNTTKSNSGDWVRNGTTPLLKLTKGDQAKLQLYMAGASKTVRLETGSRFAGRLVQTL